MNEQYELVEFIAKTSDDRLDKVLVAQLTTLSRAQIQTLIKENRVLVNGKTVKASHRIEGGEHIRVQVPVQTGESEPEPEALPLDVLYEDDQIVVINKPAGMVVHPAYGNQSGTLVNAVLALWPQTAAFSDADRAGIVHRLDKDTSGVIVIAKTEDALENLRAQFKDRAVQKHYLALVEGTPDTPEGLIDAPIGRDPRNRKKMAVIRDGREAVSEFRVLEQYADHSLLEIFPKTGRTHQIRVHLAFLGHPVVGDRAYGHRKQKIKLKRHFLHAASITLVQPETGESITVEAALPAGLQNILDKLPR